MKSKSMEQIPEMLEQMLNIFQREIDRLEALKKLSEEQVGLSLKMFHQLNQVYLAYRVLKSELKSETKQLSLEQMKENVKQAQLHLQNKN